MVLALHPRDRERGPCLSAYNNFLPATDPDTGEKVHLLGLWINHPDGRATDLGESAWYLVRHADGMQRGRDETGTGPKTRDISAPEEFWKFFEKHPLDSSSAKPEERR